MDHTHIDTNLATRHSEVVTLMNACVGLTHTGSRLFSFIMSIITLIKLMIINTIQAHMYKYMQRIRPTNIIMLIKREIAKISTRFKHI